MEQLLVPALITLAIVVVVVIIFRRPRNRDSAVIPGADRQQPRQPKTRDAYTPEQARQGSLALNAEQHQAVYSALAREQLIVAIKLYREATGVGLKDAKDLVSAMERYPQPYQAHTPTAADIGSDEDLKSAPKVFPYRYRAIASRGDETREISSNSLNDEIYDRVRAMVHDGDRQRAAVVLAHYAGISEQEAREFINLL